MKTSGLLLVLFALSAGRCPPGAYATRLAGDKKKEDAAAKVAAAKDLKLLQGSWTMTGMEANGKETPAAKLEGTILTIKDDIYTIEIKGKTVARCKLILDAKHDPKRLDMVFLDGARKDEVGKGIYRIDGAKLQIVRGLSPDQPRPDQFGTWPDTDVFMVTWTKR
ncbi:MAG: TIGR03067 domain-containing protein [Gemmataceae bacterium]